MGALLAVVLADLVPRGDPDITIFVAIMLLGFAVGAVGHLHKSPALVVAGIVLVFLGTLVLPLLVFGSGSE